MVMIDGAAAAPAHVKGPQHFQKSVLLGWPVLILMWMYLVWFVMTLYSGIGDTWQHHGENRVAFENWYRVMWAAVMPPVIFFTTYATWLGWKFFLHN